MMLKVTIREHGPVLQNNNCEVETLINAMFIPVSGELSAMITLQII